MPSSTTPVHGEYGKGSTPARSSLEVSKNGPAVSIGKTTSNFTTDLSVLATLPSNEKQDPATDPEGILDSFKSTSTFQFGSIVLALCLAIFLVALVCINFLQTTCQYTVAASW